MCDLQLNFFHLQAAYSAQKHSGHIEHVHSCKKTEVHQKAMELESCSFSPACFFRLIKFCYMVWWELSSSLVGQDGGSQGTRQGPLARTPRLACPLQRVGSPLSFQRQAGSGGAPGSKRPLSPGISIPEQTPSPVRVVALSRLLIRSQVVSGSVKRKSSA